MRRQFLFAGAILSGCFSTTALFADTGNLVQNPSFELNAATIVNQNLVPPDWFESQPSALHFVTADSPPPTGNAVDGSYYLQMGNFGQLQQYLAYTPQTGDVIHVSSWARDFGGAGAFQTSLFFDPIGTSEQNMNTGIRPVELDGGSGMQTMTHFQTDYTVPASEAGQMVGLYLATGPGYAGYDDISVTVTPAPEPASLSLFGAGAALLLRRRRARIA